MKTKTQKSYVAPTIEESELTTITVMCGSLDSTTEDYTTINDFTW